MCKQCSWNEAQKIIKYNDSSNRFTYFGLSNLQTEDEIEMKLLEISTVDHPKTSIWFILTCFNFIYYSIFIKNSTTHWIWEKKCVPSALEIVRTKCMSVQQNVRTFWIKWLDGRTDNILVHESWLFFLSRNYTFLAPLCLWLFCEMKNYTICKLMHRHSRSHDR